MDMNANTVSQFLFVHGEMKVNKPVPRTVGGKQDSGSGTEPRAFLLRGNSADHTTLCHIEEIMLHQ